MKFPKKLLDSLLDFCLNSIVVDDNAAMAEQADALASGASGGNPVEVQFLLAAPILSGARGCGVTADASA